MEDRFLTFGEFLRRRRMQDPRQLTLKELAAELGIPVTVLCDVEQGRRRAFDGELIEKLCDFLRLSPEDRALMYDLAANNKRTIPADIDSFMMYTPMGDAARFAMRCSRDGFLTQEDWDEITRKAVERMNRQKEEKLMERKCGEAPAAELGETVKNTSGDAAETEEGTL